MISIILKDLRYDQKFVENKAGKICCLDKQEGRRDAGIMWPNGQAMLVFTKSTYASIENGRGDRI